MPRATRRGATRHRRAAQVVARVVHEAGDLDAVEPGERLDLGGGLGADDGEARLGNASPHQRQDLLREPEAAIHVGVVVHDAGEDEVPGLGAGRVRRVVVERRRRCGSRSRQAGHALFGRCAPRGACRARSGHRVRDARCSKLRRVLPLAAVEGTHREGVTLGVLAPLVRVELGDVQDARRARVQDEGAHRGGVGVGHVARRGSSWSTTSLQLARPEDAEGQRLVREEQRQRLELLAPQVDRDGDRLDPVLLPEEPCRLLVSPRSCEKQAIVTSCSREKRSTSRQVMILSPRLGG